jgi:Ran GTPase-activating protein (RanGAP) involved in mRNA processing and transport
LRQDLEPELHSLLTAEDVEELSRLAFKHPIRLYRHQGSLASDAQALYKQLQEDAAAFAKGVPFSETCVGVPKTYRDNTGLSKLLADWIFPETPTPARWQKFDGWLYRMRKATEERLEKVRAEKRAAFPKVCLLPGRALSYPDALPVDIPSAIEFRDFLEELRVLPSPDGSSYPRKLGKGVLFPDGRMDLCKQVIQPCFEELCNAVAANGTIRHFLLGNNVVFRDGSKEEISARRDALLELLRTDPRIETWYLAGNGIDKDLSASLADGFKAASHVKALWLKMNPVKTGAFHFGELAAVHRSLELLDLFNTGLGDDGIQAFRDGLASQGGSSNLRHLYLSINGISDGSAVADVVRLLPNLESLFLGVNFLRDEGACLVLEALKGHPNLCRLELGANAMTDASLPHLLEVVTSAPKLRALKLGSYKSTNYFGGKHNEFTNALGLVNLAQSLAYLNVDGGMENVDLDALEDGLKNTASACYVEGSQGLVGMKRTLQTGERDPSAYRSLLHPQPFVNNIHSVYRNQM